MFFIIWKKKDYDRYYPDAHLLILLSLLLLEKDSYHKFALKISSNLKSALPAADATTTKSGLKAYFPEDIIVESEEEGEEEGIEKEGEEQRNKRQRRSSSFSSSLRPSYVPSYMPPFPSKHSYKRTPVK